MSYIWSLRQLVVALVAVVSLSMLVSLTACSSGSSAPQSPPSKDSKERKDSKNDDDDEDEDEDEDDDDDENAGDDGSEAGGEPTAGAATSDEPQEPTSFIRVGADIGDDASKEAVKKCLDSGKVFDRFSGDNGECTGVSLAKVDCTIDGIKAILTPTQNTQFDEALAGTYQGWLLDQCGDCPKGGGAEVCKSSAGVEQIGTKLFFVKEDAEQVKGKAMVLPIRPWQKDSGGASSSSTSTSTTTSTSTSTSSGSSTATSTSSSTATGTSM